MHMIRPLIAAPMLTVLLLSALCVSSAATAPKGTTCEQAQVGMQKERVLDLLGVPNSRRTEAGKIIGARDTKKITYDIWSYQHETQKGLLMCDIYFLDNRITNMMKSTYPLKSEHKSR
jgi:hypothetical protein